MPTAGHPTQKAAIIELYEQRVEQKEIALRLGISRNNVSRAISDYRDETGRYIEPIRTARRGPLPSDKFGASSDFAMRNHKKSVAGARAALEAMGL